MGARGVLRLACGPFFALLAGCSLLVGTSDIDRGCGTGTKLCDGTCVDIGNPAYGCDPQRCEPCHLAHAIPACNGQMCVVAACLDGYGCEGPNGCETNVFVDNAHCGQCDNACGDDQSCQQGKCYPPR
jgi:hypothetical protein